MKLDLDHLEALSKAGTPKPWPKDFARIDDGDGGTAATGPVIRLEDGEDEDTQAQVDQDLLFEMRNSLDQMLAEIRAGRELLGVAGRKMAYIVRDYPGDKESAKWLVTYAEYRKLVSGEGET